MALQTSWTDPDTQVTAPTAYARVIGINVDAINQIIDLTIGLYYTQAARAAGGKPFAPPFHAWPAYAALLGEAVDVRAAAYNFLKTLPEFTGASDV